ncbi:hypothetical protein BDP55DRAFT_663353 [Colletotrichum godetiae]|uniref:Uncharacterized protein n=1 Tax=Colletotrichum godetiae TaxID=1209918 RepID=A0AAJ0EXX6_9PEZI|nr:uncharacterized protein BDP55DRAFT_663353 [Colletotrichum godetiae]KAK1675655.1 hypothetical protein BDP55DRAFT_663353 [Colletotrichum godetiae]
MVRRIGPNSSGISPTIRRCRVVNTRWLFHIAAVRFRSMSLSVCLDTPGCVSTKS